MSAKPRKALRSILLWGTIFYISVAAIVGTTVIAWPFILIFYNATAPAPMPVLLPNGFYYSPDWNSSDVNNHITDENGVEIIASDVRQIMWHDDWIYGYRLGHANEVYYFICRYGSDCTKSQIYKDMEFKRLLKKYDLPEFTRWERKGYDELLREQEEKGIDTGHGG